MRMTAESTFGAGSKAEAGTLQINSGSPKIWTWRERTECLPLAAMIFFATSFCTMKTMIWGGLPCEFLSLFFVGSSRFRNCSSR